MTLPASAFPVLRTQVLLVALGSVVLSASHAAAGYHDIQAMRIPPLMAAPHDRAPSPAERIAR